MIHIDVNANTTVDNKVFILLANLCTCVHGFGVRMPASRMDGFYRLMSHFIRIRHWDNLYENSRSRAIEKAKWVPIPNKHDGLGFSRIMARKDGLEVFACWILILQVASKCKKRGDLIEADGAPLSIDDIILQTRINPNKKKVLQTTIDFLLSPQILWIERVSHGNDTQPSLECQAGVTHLPKEGKGIEEKEEKEGKELGATLDQLLDIFIEETPSLPTPLRDTEPARKKAVMARFKKLDNDLDAWRGFCKRLETSDFLAGRTDKPFTCGIDWALKTANFTKILEGTYDNKKSGKPSHEEKYSPDRNF